MVNLATYNQLHYLDEVLLIPCWSILTKIIITWYFLEVDEDEEEGGEAEEGFMEGFVSHCKLICSEPYKYKLFKK